jgi:dihydropyrimidinase
VFEGKTVSGLPRFTLTRGHVAVQDGEMRSREGHGQFVPREARPAVNRAYSTWKDLTAPRPVVRTGVPVTGV